MRVKATIEYDGSKFYGFQVQREGDKNILPTVISRIEALLKALHIHSKVEGSGRTDRGVHATGQVIAFDLPEYWSDLGKLINILNDKLEYIRFKTLKPCDEAFSPRYHAKSRVYRYIVSPENSRPFLLDYVAFTPALDCEKIQEGIRLFEGEHDFVMFRKSGSEEKTTVRTIYKARFYRYRNIYVFYFEGNAFLRSQIRMMVDALLKLSSGMISASQLKSQIDNEVKWTSTLAPAAGLYLAKVKY